MSPLNERTIATVGSGMMAEAMIAGLLRAGLVEPDRIVASHGRPERREHLARDYGIRTVASNVEAVEAADVVLLAIKPQMLARVGREIGPHLRRGQLVLSVLAGATTAALTGFLGHDQVVRSMPNTPARLGRGMTVWYATPETTPEQRAQARALLSALGAELEVDDEKMVAMATAVSGTGPTYVFLVMEALIDAAVHLGFPRHIAHDLVIETLEGSTLFAKQSGMHPGRAAEHGHLARRHERGGPPRARIGASPDRPVGSRLGGLSADRRARRPAGGERSTGRARRCADPRGPPAADWRAAVTGQRGSDPSGRQVDLRRAPLAVLRGIDFRAPSRDFWTDEGAIWDRFRVSWAGLDDAAWRLPGAAPSDAGGPDWSLFDHVAHVAHWQELAIEYVAHAEATGVWPSDDDYDGGDFDGYNERSRAAWASLEPATVRERLLAGHAGLLAVARRLPLEVIRGDDGWGWVYLTLHGHQLDHLAILEPWSEALRERQAQNDPFVPDPRPASGDDGADVASFWAAESSAMAIWDSLVRSVPLARWTAGEPTPGWTLRDHVAHVADWFEEGAAAIEGHAATGAWRDGPAEGFDAWNERQLEARRELGPAEVLDRFDATHERLKAATRAMSAATLWTADGWSWAYECLHGHVRSHLAMVGPWCARVGWPDPEEV